jgi:gas vesicle protein
MRGAVSFVVGAILGSLVGASLAILLAPMSGQELRNEINDRARSISEEVEMAAKARRAELEKQLEQLRNPVKPTDIQVQ